LPKFSFRLESVRRYRVSLESIAKDNYRDAQRRVFECEQDIKSIYSKIDHILAEPALSIPDRLALEGRIARQEDQIQHQVIILQVLQSDETEALVAWVEAKKELEILEKLRENRRAEWLLDENRLEQAALDEWAVTRRKPA